MKLRIVLCCFFMLIVLSLWQSPSFRPTSESAGPTDLNSASNVLYIIPGTGIWSGLPQESMPVGINALTGKKELFSIDQPIYYLKDFPASEGEDAFTSIFGSDWMVVPVEGRDSLFRLIAANLPEPDNQLYPLHLDPAEYPLETVEFASGWPQDDVPRTVLLKWAEWWRNETNSTPVVLIMVRF